LPLATEVLAVRLRETLFNYCAAVLFMRQGTSA
jgi:hypothetical protein